MDSPSNSNSSTSPSPAGTETPVEAPSATDCDGRAKRFDYLLKQTEVFSHFMGGTKAKSPLKMKEPKAAKKDGKAKNAKDGDHRY